ncbi:DUF1672 domain-containing protein [Sporolactobacillus sp. CPB3-1]|uniref:DUF1672 domain-containing protein n=1 Tax=Sporolactobacillus mangiferae TaxID=2940498 RepID=A0ABT0M7D8_9BACL|nr:DUF1672 family protein [Sporolactobacillus mangiferae]MCL1630783.1 DUF1672 domain-containing protein [Sporolactobacillus mangiferae]
MKLVIPALILSLLLGGCSTLNNDHQDASSTKKQQEKQYENNFISVQKYTGQGYSLDGGEENDKIAEAHRDEVIKAAEKFFLSKYKTKVKVHNLVGNKDGVTVFVESIGEPHFYTYAVVPINEQKIATDHVFSEEGQVEDAIRTGIYAMIYDREFKNLDNLLEKFVSVYPVIGLNKKAVENVGGDRYSTPYYYLSISEDAFSTDLFKEYLNHPHRNHNEWRNRTEDVEVNPKLVFITIQLYMKDLDQEPNKQVFKQLVIDIEKIKNIPPGAYTILLHDNKINKKDDNGQKQNSLERGDPKEIIKY